MRVKVLPKTNLPKQLKIILAAQADSKFLNNNNLQWGCSRRLLTQTFKPNKPQMLNSKLRANNDRVNEL